MLGWRVKTYLSRRTTAAVESEVDDDEVDETGVDIIQALDILTTPTNIPTGSRVEDDLHSPRVGDLALHSPRIKDLVPHSPRHRDAVRAIKEEGALSSPRTRSNLPPPPAPSLSLCGGERAGRVTENDHQPVSAQPPPVKMNLALRQQQLRRELAHEWRRKQMTAETVAAVRRGKIRSKLKLLATSVLPPQAADECPRKATTMFPQQTLSPEQPGLSTQKESTFSDYRMLEDDHRLVMTGHVCVNGEEEFRSARLELDLRTALLTVSHSLTCSVIQLQDIHTVQVDSTGKLLRILPSTASGSSRQSELTSTLLVTLATGVATSTLLAALEFWRRKQDPAAIPLILFCPNPALKKLEAWSWLVEWFGLESGLRSEVLGPFWYKQGDITDTRDWARGVFYLKNGVLYGCEQEGQLPHLTIDLVGEGELVGEEETNRFQVRVGSLTLSSPSCSTALWTRSILAQATQFKRGGERKSTRYKSFHTSQKELVLVTEPSGTVLTRIQSTALLRVLANQQSCSLQLAWLEEGRGIGGSIIFQEERDFAQAQFELGRHLEVKAYLHMGTSQQFQPDAQSKLN